MLVYRIILKKYSRALIAPGIAGRWNKEGAQVIYTAESIPVAFMESMIRRKGLGFNDQFGIMVIEVPDRFLISEINADKLAQGWRDDKDYSFCQAAAADWYNNLQSPVLKVPSAVIATDFNYVLNAIHPEFAKIRIIATTDLIPDERIEEILKNQQQRRS